MAQKYVIVHANGGRIEIGDGQGDKPELEFLQQAVGGWIEHVYVKELDGTGIDCFCNEEGKLQGLPVNFPATRLVEPYGMLVGDVVFVASDDEGESRWLTDEQVQKAQEVLG